MTHDPSAPIGRVLEDGCTTCLRSLTYCDAVTYLDGPGIRCCTACSH